MIMAGRGKRFDSKLKKVGKETESLENLETYDLETLTKKINEINLESITSSDLNSIQHSFPALCTSKDVTKEILKDFHARALNDSKFGEKFLVALEPIFGSEIFEEKLRIQFLPFLQDDFISKETLAKTNKKKFLNGVLLCAHFYRIIKVFGTPISILSVAVMDYIDMLLKGDEDDLKVLALVISSVGNLLSAEEKISEKFSLLPQTLREILVNNRSLSVRTKCLLLLSTDIIANKYKPLAGTVKDFYMKHLGEEYRIVDFYSELVNSYLSDSEGLLEASQSQKGKKKEMSVKISNMNLQRNDDKMKRFDEKNKKGSGNEGKLGNKKLGKK